LKVLPLIKKRRSIRKYKSTPLEKEKLEHILEAGRLAPSAANKQPWYFIVVTDPLQVANLRSSYGKPWETTAPAILAVCVDPSIAWVRKRDGETFWKVDAAIALQNMVLCATEEGIGTCWVASFDEDIARKGLQVPDGIRVVAMTPLGYPDEVKGEVTERKSLKEIVHYEKY
jgi:nitroreductase